MIWLRSIIVVDRRRSRLAAAPSRRASDGRGRVVRRLRGIAARAGCRSRAPRVAPSGRRAPGWAAGRPASRFAAGPARPQFPGSGAGGRCAERADSPQGRRGPNFPGQALEYGGVRLRGVESFGEDIGAADQVHPCRAVEQAALDAGDVRAMVALDGLDEDGLPLLDDRAQWTTAELLDGDLAWAGDLDCARRMGQQTVVVEQAALDAGDVRAMVA